MPIVLLHKNSIDNAVTLLTSSDLKVPASSASTLDVMKCHSISIKYTIVVQLRSVLNGGINPIISKIWNISSSF